MTTVPGVESFVLPPWAKVNDKRKGHIMRVTRLLADWATALRV